MRLSTPTPISQVHVRTVGLISAEKGAIDDEIRMAVVIDVRQGQARGQSSRTPEVGGSPPALR
jgi:hypothetical protein